MDEAWDNLSDSDLVELSEVGDDLAAIVAEDLAAIDDPAVDEVGLAPVRPGGTPRSTLPDLPAPVGPRPTRGAARKGSNTLTDLPAPVGPLPRRNIPDLLAPVGPRSSRANAPTPTTTPISLPVSMPAPIPTPVGRAGESTPPTSRAPATPQRSHPTAPQAAAPKAMHAPTAPPRAQAPRPQAPAIGLPDDIDLPAPVGPAPTRHLPDLLAPVGPSPTRASSSNSTGTAGISGTTDLPAPKGFFDDGVQPKSNSGSGLPAPKGFFDDGVQPRLGSGPVDTGHEPLDLDFGMELGAGSDGDADAHAASGDLVAAAAFDLGDPVLGDPVASGGVNRPFGLDAADLELERQDVTPPPLPLELSDGPLSGSRSPRSRTSRLELELSPPGESALSGGAPPSGLTFGKSSAPATTPPPMRGRTTGGEDPFAPGRAAGHMHTTEIQIEVDRASTPGLAALPASVTARKAVTARVATPPKKSARAAIVARRRMMLLGGVLAAAALTAGGFTAWKWVQGRQARDARTATGLRQVEKLLADDAPRHWEQAASEAQRVAAEDAQDLEALAVVAEASFAAALDESPQAAERVKEGDKALGGLRARSAKGPHAGKAEALRAILSTNFAQAVERLDQIRRTAPTDGDAQLYLGWALAAQEQHGPAVAAYKAALGKGKPRIAALYGLGLSQLELGDKPAAEKSFQAVIQNSRDRYKRDHLGALIGLAQLAPVSERESRYQELMARPDLPAAPARAVSRLRALAGDEALRAGRHDQARTRYDEARALDPLNLRATVGLARVAARAGDLAGARNRLLDDVLGAAPDHIEGALALIEVAMAEKQLEEAEELVDALFARKPPIASGTLLGRVYLARARVYDASPDKAVQAKAEVEYREAMKRADPGDFAATVGLSALFMRLGRKQEAVEVLGPIRAAAREDAGLALTLGSAYLAAGQTDDAVEAFRSVLARRPDDAEARFQLGHAFLAQGEFEEAIDSLRRAYEIDPSREDIGLGLARTLEAGGRAREAAAAYRKMLDGERKPSLTVRGQAGRAFARMGMGVEATAQGDAIRQEDPRDPNGQFLLGEKLYWEDRYEEALKAYRDASRNQVEAQFLEAQGRASEKLGQYEDALRAYGEATAADPSYLAPRLGRGRVRLARREYTLAVAELEAAMKSAPDDPGVVGDLGRAYVAMRDLAHAVPLLERAAKLDASDASIQYTLGEVYYEMDRPRVAAQYLSRAVDLAGDEATWRAEAFRQLGYAQRAAHNRSGAISAWRRYLAIERKDGPVRRDVERMLMRMEAR